MTFNESDEMECPICDGHGDLLHFYYYMDYPPPGADKCYFCCGTGIASKYAVKQLRSDDRKKGFALFIFFVIWISIVITGSILAMVVIDNGKKMYGLLLAFAGVIIGFIIGLLVEVLLLRLMNVNTYQRIP